MTSAAEEGMSAYGIAYSGESAAGWTIRTYGSNMTIESVKNDLYEYIKELNAGVDNAIDLLNCSQIGISVGIHSDGTYFWMVIFS
jgi:hypothetical protein